MTPLCTSTESLVKANSKTAANHHWAKSVVAKFMSMTKFPMKDF